MCVDEFYKRWMGRTSRQVYRRFLRQLLTFREANLNHVHTTTTYNQSFTALYIYLFGGNENVQLAKTLTINATIVRLQLLGLENGKPLAQRSQADYQYRLDPRLAKRF